MYGCTEHTAGVFFLVHGNMVFDFQLHIFVASGEQSGFKVAVGIFLTENRIPPSRIWRERSVPRSFTNFFELSNPPSIEGVRIIDTREDTQLIYDRGNRLVGEPDADP